MHAAEEEASGVSGGTRWHLAGWTLGTEVRLCTVLHAIFNISKINSEVRGGKSPRIKRLSEYIGESYFEYLAGLPDLVLIMDESHRYRASAGVRAINELKPVIGLELTATPFVEGTGGRSLAFKNVVLDYPLGKAMADGFVKEPAVVTRKNFNPAGMTAEAIELMRLQDGVRLHEQVKVELETYARESGNVIVKPFLLVIARDIAHDKFQEIVDEAKKPDSAIRSQQVILEPEQLGERTVTVVSQSQLAGKLGLQPERTTTSTLVPEAAEPPAFKTPEDQQVAQITYQVIRKFENQPLPH